MSTSYAPTTVKKVDVLAVSGYIPVSCKLVSGKIVRALSAAYKGTAPSNVADAYYSVGAGRYFLWADGKLYSSVSGTNFITLATMAASSPFFVESRNEDMTDITYFFCDSAVIKHMSKSFTSALLSEGLACGVVKCDRLFGADLSDGLKLRWSGPDGVMDWTKPGAGWAYLDISLGNIINVCDVAGKLIVVHEMGLTRMNAYGNPDNFAVERIYRVPNILKDTAAVIGDKLYFCSQDNMYCYSDSGVSIVDDGLFSMLTPTKAKAYGENYMIIGYHTGIWHECLYIYNTLEKSSYLCDFPATAFAGNEELFAYMSGGGAYSLCISGERYRFISGTFDFGSRKPKMLLRLEVTAEREYYVTVNNGAEDITFTGGTEKVINCNIRGVEFTVTVESDDEVSGVMAYAEVESGI